MRLDENFVRVMEDCGYDTKNPKNKEEQQVINVAKCAWDDQQCVIDALRDGIATFKRSLENL